MGLSALNSQRNKYNFIFDDICPACGTDHETVIHYIFNCISYNALRETILRKLRNIFPEHCDLLLIIDENQKHTLLHIFETGLNLEKKRYEKLLDVINYTSIFLTLDGLFELRTLYRCFFFDWIFKVMFII